MSCFRRLASAATVAVALVSCVPAEGEDDFGENSPMAAIQAAGVLRVAVPAGRPPFAAGEAPEVEGFSVDLARAVADDLGVDLSVATLEVEEMREAVAGGDPTEFGDGRVDIAFTFEPLTQELFKVTSVQEGFEVTTPYYVAHQRLLVPAGSGLEQVDDLGGRRVCSLLDPVAGVSLVTLEATVETLGAAAPGDCAEALAGEEADAATALDDALATVAALLRQEGAALDVSIVGDQLSTVGYPVLVDQGMAGYVSSLLNEIEEAGTWTEAYERWVEPLAGEPAAPPGITLEDAAALYPIELE